MTQEEYAKLPGITASAIKAGRKSMAHMRVAMLSDRTDEGNDAMRFGTLAHMALLEPVRFASSIAVWNGGRRAGKEWDKWCADNADKIQVSPDDLDKLMAMHDASLADKDARFALAQASEFELVIQWQDDHFSIAGRTIGKCKARLDGSGPSVIVEYKTCREITPRRFLSQAEALGYTLQLAWYWHAAGRPNNVWVVAQETTEPFCCVTYQVPPTILEPAYAECVEIAKRYRVCEAVGSFPGPCETVQQWERPAWATGEEWTVEE